MSNSLPKKLLEKKLSHNNVLQDFNFLLTWKQLMDIIAQFGCFN